MPIGCVLFLFYYLCSEFLEIILKEMRGLAIIFRFFMLLVLLLPVVALCPVKAETTSEGPILIVTSYNPETRSISDNLSAFMDEYRQRGGKYTPIIESMNCKNLWLSGNFWLLSFKISYLCLPLFHETRTTPSCHPSGCAYRQL